MAEINKGSLKIGVEVKRCKDCDRVEVCRCKVCANGYHKTDTTVMCKIWNRLMITEDYCSYGSKDEETKRED